MPSRKSLACLLAACLAVLLHALPAGAQTTPRFGQTTTLLPNGNVLIAGGVIGGVSSRNVEIWAPAKNAFLAGITQMNVARASHTATLLPNGRVLVTGGVNNAGGLENTGEVYDPEANTWTAAGNTMFDPRENHTATLLNTGLVLVVAGQKNLAQAPSSLSNSCDLYDPAANTFNPCPTMNVARGGHTATLLHNGRVFAAGGYDFTATTATVTTETYDPLSNTWTPGTPLITARGFHTATALGNKTVLIAGGYNGREFHGDSGILESVEIYNPIAGSISPAAPMAERKRANSATLMPDGRLEVFGGLGNVTTSYFSYPGDNLSQFNAGSTLSNQVTVTVGSATVLSAGTSLSLTPTFTLSVPANGVIAAGDIHFSSPVVQLADGLIVFKATSTTGNLSGIRVGNQAGNPAGLVSNQTVTLDPVAGLVQFTPQNVFAVSAVILAAASNVTFPGPIGPAGGSANLTGGTLNALVDIPFPATDIGGCILNGNLQIKSGVISNVNYAVTLNGGASGNIVGACPGGGDIVSDGAGGAHLGSPIAATFTGLAGNITNNQAAGNINSPLDVSGQKITGASFLAKYTVSPLNLSAVAFKFDVATIVVREMVFSDLEVYNPSLNTWSFGVPNYPAFGHTSVLLPNGDNTFFGGRTCTPGLPCGSYSSWGGPGAYINIPETALPPYTASGNLATARGNHTVTLLPDGRVLAAGGTNGASVLTSSELYDPASRKWSKTGTMSIPRNLHTATLLTNGTVLAAGGFTTGFSTGEVNSAEIFYPNAGGWVPTSPMISSRSYHTAVLLPNGNVMVTGGFANSQYISQCEIYYSTGQTWSALRAMNAARALHTATLLQNGKVLVAGGVNGISGVLPSVEIYDPAANTWTTVTALNTGRHSHSATLLRDGRVLVAGGDDGFTGEIGRAEIYDPAANTWTRSSAIGNDVPLPRLKHSAVLLPNGKVLLTGGVSALGQAILDTEQYDVDLSSWSVQGNMTASRGYHSTVLLRNNRVLTVGGFNGLSYLTNTEDKPFDISDPDQQTPGPSARRPAIVSLDTGTILNNGQGVTLNGSNFLGITEASGGGGAGRNSSFDHPRVYVQRLDASGNNSAGGSGFMVDLSTRVFNRFPPFLAPANPNPWSTINSSISVVMPDNPGLLPFGLYFMRVAANAQFSDGQLLQVGPPRPTGTPGIPSGFLSGPSSVTWTWAAASGVFDGYNIYAASGGVFLGTAPPIANPFFVQTGLGPDSFASISVAAYTLSGDGPINVSTIPVATLSSAITGLKGAGQSPTSIFWSWSPVTAATAYNVFSASTNTLLAQPVSNSYTETGLSTNTAYGVHVQALTGAGPGMLTPNATAFTLAATPLPNFSPLSAVTPASFLAQWLTNTNPPQTSYRLNMTSQFSSTPVVSNVVGISSFTESGLSPNVLYTVSVAAINGDGVATPFALLGTTATLANPPANPAVVYTLPSAIAITWSGNGNPGYTPYQVLLSSDVNFVTNVSTPIPFSLNYTTASAILSGLLTGVTYYMQISAENQSGQQTASVQLQAFTNNGGGPPGSLAISIPKGAPAELQGTIASGRTIDLVVPGGSFDANVLIFIASQSALHCGAINDAISVTVVPPLEPHFPVRLSLSFDPADPAIGPLATLGMVRWDSASNTCVPLSGRVDSGLNLMIAQSNHLSDFQLRQLAPSVGISDARVFPNPVYMHSQGYVTFDRLPAGARVRVFTLHGEEIFNSGTNSSGIVTWNATNKVGRSVASGVYLAVIESGGDKRIMKVAVVR